MMERNSVRGTDRWGARREGEEGGLLREQGTLEVRTDGARGVIKGEGTLEAGTDRGTHGMRMIEPEEWGGWMRRKEAEEEEGGERRREGGKRI